MQLSIVIPTFNERDNIEPLVDRIVGSLSGVVLNFDIWFIDDSTDDTPDILHQISRTSPQVRFIHRSNGGGLARAVVDGFKLAKGECLIVMDADLQHPPELLPIIYRRLQDGHDVVIPSRFITGGSDGGLNLPRKLVSWSARNIGQLMLRKLRRISDCTGGYFGVRRQVIQDANLNPIGWKILIEVLVKGRYQTVHEVPYAFIARDAGQSKMSLHQQWNYVVHISKLRIEMGDNRRTRKRLGQSALSPKQPEQPITVTREPESVQQ